MTTTRQQMKRLFYGLSLLVTAGTALGNNIAVTNLSLVTVATDTVDVQFNVSWDHSWRSVWTEAAAANVSGTDLTLENWDAAWVFFKWRTDNVWKHATLSTNGYTAPEGTSVKISPDGLGALIYRSAVGSGTFQSTVKLRWKRVADGAGSLIDLSAHAIEMVYVPQGAFKVGSGSIKEEASFTDGSWTGGAGIPFLIAGEDALTVTNAAGYLWSTSSSITTSTNGGYGTLSSAYPKGYQAFYCMKYEITQGQYTAFLNQLTLQQATERYSASNAGVNRYTITGTHPNFTASSPNRANNHMSWADGLHYVTWAGLRPMTELEFEKVCRGPLHPIPGEYAWGDASITQITALNNDGTENETPSSETANCAYKSGVDGPVRAGACARASSGRHDAGASYWGIMELSGNLWERVVTVGNTYGRSFTNVHGTGTWDFPTGWPTVASGYGVRGCAWNSIQDFYLNTSDRSYASVENNNRSVSYGWRGVRTAP
ncbi:MAG: SUMF1/EgtB/PvdO family nonheme iron enzyme [Kiritimatiellae bacterium]|nr:SUMF1/EgtB/PvdO family nonheme iron enzyme [Kiritimatiellia bacterium]